MSSLLAAQAHTHDTHKYTHTHVLFYIAQPNRWALALKSDTSGGWEISHLRTGLIVGFSSFFSFSQLGSVSSHHLADSHSSMHLDGSKAATSAAIGRHHSASAALLWPHLAIHVEKALLSGPTGSPEHAGEPLERWVGAHTRLQARGVFGHADRTWPF